MDNSTSRKRLYADVVKGEPSPTWLRDFQREDEEEAFKMAVAESVKVTIL